MKKRIIDLLLTIIFFLMYLSVISFIVNRTQLLNSSISIAVATIIVIVISYILSKITVNRIVNYN